MLIPYPIVTDGVKVDNAFTVWHPLYMTPSELLSELTHYVVREDVLQRVTTLDRPEVMFQLVQLLPQLYPAEGQSYDVKALAVRLGVDLDTILRCMLLLDGAPYHVVRSEWAYYDGDVRYPVSVETVMESVKAESFLHPITGEAVLDWMNAVGIEYYPSTAIIRV